LNPEREGQVGRIRTVDNATSNDLKLIRPAQFSQSKDQGTGQKVWLLKQIFLEEQVSVQSIDNHQMNRVCIKRSSNDRVFHRSLCSLLIKIEANELNKARSLKSEGGEGRVFEN
jgi:hypothetical protein